MVDGTIWSSPRGTLEYRYKKKPISAEENLAILRQILSAPRHLHERENPIVPGDIKASNIIVRPQDLHPLHVKLSGFGYKNPTVFTYGMHYTAPEIYARRDVDASVDIRALGVVATQLSHGFPRIARRQTHSKGVFTDNFIRTQSQTELFPMLSDGMVSVEATRC